MQNIKTWISSLNVITCVDNNNNNNNNQLNESI